MDMDLWRRRYRAVQFEWYLWLAAHRCGWQRPRLALERRGMGGRQWRPVALRRVGIRLHFGTRHWLPQRCLGIRSGHRPVGVVEGLEQRQPERLVQDAQRSEQL